MVFVLDTDKNPLDPCHPARARKLLKTGRAKIFKKYPFTIILNKQVKEINNHQYRLKIDYGSRCTGLAILKNSKEVIWLGQIEHRTNIKEKLDTKRGHRRFRRNKLRYRKPRFNNRKRKEGWIPPSLQSRADNIYSWVNKLKKLIPITLISYENVKFDTQLMQNAEISGIEYQQGTLNGSVACRSTGSFNINLIKGRVQGINHKYCQIVQRFDGYKYIIKRKKMELSHSSNL